jgi:hypothetical protein
MLKVTLSNGTVIEIHWQHFNSANKEFVEKPGTKCTIFNNESPISDGRSFLHEKDTFCRAKGRLTSLKRCMYKFSHKHKNWISNGMFVKEDRTIIWAEYLKQFNKSVKI